MNGRSARRTYHIFQFSRMFSALQHKLGASVYGLCRKLAGLRTRHPRRNAGIRIGSAKTRETREKMAAEYGIVTMEKNADVAAQADMLVLAVKPQFFEEVIHEIKDATRPETLIISIAAGKSIQWIEDAFARPVKLVRCMPALPIISSGFTISF